MTRIAAPRCGDERIERSMTVSGEVGAAALVMFADDTSLNCLRLLRRGFRHCFVAVAATEGWIICDPRSPCTDLAFVTGFDQTQVATWYRDLGLCVVETCTLQAPLRPAPIRPFTCVEAVKRVLGVHAPWVLTPWQLYRLLTSSCNSRLTSRP